MCSLQFVVIDFKADKSQRFRCLSTKKDANDAVMSQRSIVLYLVDDQSEEFNRHCLASVFGQNKRQNKIFSINIGETSE